MNKFWKRGICLLLVVCTLAGYIVLPDVPAAKADTATTDASVALGPNLIANSTFGEIKSVTTYPQCAMPANWAFGGGKVADKVYLAVTNEYAYDGEYSMKLSDTLTSAAISAYQNVTDLTPEDAGFSIVPSFFARGEGSVTLTLEFYNSDTSFVTSGASKTFIKSHSDTFTMSNDWKEYSISNAVIPEGTESVRYKITTKSADVSEFYFDSVALHVAGEERNRLVNNSFETLPSKTPTTQNIGGMDTTGWGNLDSSAMFSVIADDRDENGFVLQLADNSASAGDYVYYQVKATSGKYTLKLEYNTENAPQIIVRSGAHDSTGTQLLSQKLSATNGTWKSYETTLQVSADAPLFVLISSGAGEKNEALFDNVSLQKQGASDDDDIYVPEGNLLTNGTFEKEVSGEVVENKDGWKGWKEPFSSLVPEEGKEGNFVVKCDDQSTTGGVNVYYTMTIPKAGKYTIKFDYKGAFSYSEVKLILRQGSLYGNENNVEQNVISKTSWPTDTWKTYESTFEIMDAGVTVYIIISTGSGTLGTAYLDNFYFSKIADDVEEEEGGTVAPEDVIKVPEENLVHNPKFEMTVYSYRTPVAADQAPNGWTLETKDTGAQLFKTNVEKYKGQWTAQFVDNSNKGSVKLSTKVDNIQAGEKYTYSYARIGSGKLAMVIRFYNEAGRLLQEVSDAQAGFSTWREKQTTIAAPAGASYAVVSLETKATDKCDMYVDALTFFLTDDESKTNLLPNASFEEYPETVDDILISVNNTSTMEGWTISGTKYVSMVQTETAMDKAAVGNYMIKIDDDTDQGGGSVYYNVKVQPGKRYTFSAMVKGKFEAGAPSIRMNYYQDADCTIPAYSGKYSYKATTATSSDAYWSRVSVGVVVPENCTTVRVMLNTSNAAVGCAYYGNVSLVEGIDTKFHNLDMEDLDESGAVQSWDSYEGGKLSAYTKDPIAGKVSLAVKDNSQAVQQGAISKLTDLSGYQIVGFDTTGLVYTITARVKDAKNVKAQFEVVFYGNDFQPVHTETITTDGSGKWQFLVAVVDFPANSAYVTVGVKVGTNASATGTVYLDDVTMVDEYTQLMDEAYDWDIKYSEGNRLFYNAEELEQIKKFAFDDTINTLGVSGANAYRKLIKKADQYIAEKGYYATWSASADNDRVTKYYVNMEHIQDISADPLLADVPGGRNWPYLESIAGTLCDKFQAVSLAYAITGDTKYADRAIGWIMDLCEWEYWDETKYSWPWGYITGMGTSRMLIGIATVYDMCYDRMTQEQRDIVAQNIIYKGLKPLYRELNGTHRLDPDNKYMTRAAACILGALAIINEDNKDEVGKYLDRGYEFTKLCFDRGYYTAYNEGYSYARVTYEETLVALNCAARVTGRKGMIDHPYFTEVFIDWVADFMGPGSSQLPVISDSYPNVLASTMLILSSELGSGEAAYFVRETGLDDDPFMTLLFANNNPEIVEPDENDYVVYSERVGYGGLRTGWDDGDLMLYIIGSTSDNGHIQYDQLSFCLFTNGRWPAMDPGYSNLTGDFLEVEGHSTIVVDGVGQNVRGVGSLSQIVDSQLYGQFSGSAPNAYMDADEDGKLTIPKLTQFDRHAIMLNHGDRPYYIIIDELASNEEHTFDFNLNTGGWTDITVDGKPMAAGEVVQGNRVSIQGSQGLIFAEFVSKDKMNIEGKMYDENGPLLQADSGSGKSKQFMTIISKEYGLETDEEYSFLPLLKTPDLYTYKTSSKDNEITKSVSASGNALFFFRGHAVGDWIELPFTLSESGTYNLTLKTAKSYNYGVYKIYIDGEYVSTYDGANPKVFLYYHEMGEKTLEAGEHTLKLELVGCNSITGDKLISFASLIFGEDRELAASPIYTQQVYDTDKVLGAKIYHSENNSDIVLLNRTTGKISAGGVTTNGEQAVIIGLMEDGYMEGYTVIAGTSLALNGTTLMKSSSAATVSADYRGKAKYAVTTEKKQTISFYAPYEIVGASVDGKDVECKISGNVASLTVPAGTHTVALKVKDAVEYMWGHESGSGKAIYNENGELTYKYWKDVDGTEYLFEDGQLKIDAYYDPLTKLLVREELLENGDWQITYYDAARYVTKIEIEHTNGNLTTIAYQKDGSISTTITDKRGDYLEMTMDYPDGSKTVAEYLDDKTVTTKYGANGNALSITTMYNDGKRIEETYDASGKLLSKITRYKGGSREETVYNADGSSVTSIYTANKLTGLKTVNADGTAVLEEYLENGSVRVTKYDASGNVTEVTVDGVLVVEEEPDDNTWIIIVIVAVAVVAVAVLVIVLVKIKKRNAKESASAE
ncbi:MAG: hypothetical protein E7455_06105 [Ruminococcaceae bacterium]|nr:hypothetical protein [Oscillospiraceae bacterium]